MEVRIRTIDKDIEERNELLGIDKSSRDYADFTFKESSLDGVWVDETDAILFYIRVTTFVADYNPELLAKLINIINNFKHQQKCVIVKM